MTEVSVVADTIELGRPADNRDQPQTEVLTYDDDTGEWRAADDH